jgi:hypothetical protein
MALGTPVGSLDQAQSMGLAHASVVAPRMSLDSNHSATAYVAASFGWRFLVHSSAARVPSSTLFWAKSIGLGSDVTPVPLG